jgi:putative tricarboxylic transport membrane protein
LSEKNGRSAVSVRTVEIGVAAILLVFGAVVALDNHRLGAKWDEDGPQAGYFPFYVGLLICVSSAVILVRAVRARALAAKSFVERGQLATIMAVLIPTAVYVGLIGWLGLYVSSALYIAYFMRRLGKYGLALTAAVALGVSIAFFLVFEIWFGVPLPKGPLEAALGLN